MQARRSESSRALSRRSFTLATALVTLASGCSDSTSEQRVQLRTEVALHGSATFDNALGWHVELDGVWLSIGSLRLLEGAPLGSRAPQRPSLLDLLVKTAHAHPGHYHEGAVLAEMLSPQSVNLLVPTELESAEAVTGEPLSGQIVVTSPAVGAHAERLGETVVRLEGVARPTDTDDEPRHFVATATIAELGGMAEAVEITGCPYDGGPIRAAGTLHLGIDGALWLDQVDFSGLDATASDSPVSLASDSRAHNGFLRGLVKAAAYRFDLRSHL